MTDLHTLHILDVGPRGDGVAEGPVYAPFTLPGEVVRARLDGERALVDAIERASPERVDPACPHFGVCGGCALQHWRLEGYRTWKCDLLVQALARAGVEAPVRPLIDATGAGRRRASLHAVRAKAVGFVFGFARRGSHDVFDLEACPVLAPGLASALPALRELARALLGKPGRLDVSATLSDTGLDVDIRGRIVGAEAASRIAGEIGGREGWARVTADGVSIFQLRTPSVAFDGLDVVLPPGGAFLQATAAGEITLRRLITEAVPAGARIVELYAGLGTFTGALARKGPVRAVEGAGAAIAALERAAKRATGLKPITILRRDLAREPLTSRELGGLDLAVLDPPRAGAFAQVQEIAKSKIETVVSVSCNPATFARDAAVLIAAGFTLDAATPIDQFLWSPHVEALGVFRR